MDEEDSITHDGIHVIYLYKIMENEIYEKKKLHIFSFVSSMKRIIYLLKIPLQIPPPPLFLWFLGKKQKKKSLHKEL